VVDRANPIGKRDYAILKLAACLGMRSGDIAGLKLENIDWGKNLIRYEQQKGGQPLTLPLLNDVGESIIDYLKNGRPQSGLRLIFLKHCAPYTGLTGAALHPIMKKYLRLANLPGDPPRKAGLHTLRHSLASALLEDATPLPIISEVLGHRKTATTRMYTTIDVASLKKCALEVPAPIVEGGRQNDGI
jgi:integrase